MSDNLINVFIIGIIVIILILAIVVCVMTLKDKMKKMAEKQDNNYNNENEEKKAKESIFKFMEFDTIEDNMIVQDNGKKYLMVIECKGVNYDLLSNLEKASIEQGFLQFLNTLKYEIQLYVQTRKVNLFQSINSYKERLRNIEMDMRDEEARYTDMQRSGNYTRDELLKEIKEVTKKRNLYEYGKDIIENTEQMGEDSDLSTKEYYIVVPYYTDEITSAGDFDKKEIGSMAFSELYTRAQSLVSALGECEVRGRIMNSQELIELLYVAYNREQYDIYDFESYMSQSGFQSFYSVAEDVLDKKMRALDEEIEKKANEKALDAYKLAYMKVDARRKRIEDREKKMQEYVDSLANKILDNESSIIGEGMANLAKTELKNMNNEKDKDVTEQNEKNDNSDINIVQNEPKKKKRVLTEEEKKRRRAILKKRKLLKEREAKKNAKE